MINIKWISTNGFFFLMHLQVLSLNTTEVISGQSQFQTVHNREFHLIFVIT